VVNELANTDSIGSQRVQLITTRDYSLANKLHSLYSQYGSFHKASTHQPSGALIASHAAG